MNWQLLLETNIIKSKTTDKENIRSPFLRDVDRILFSSYFRKLQDKTQVYPLAKSSYVRTRLTHSLEVSTVGRSLGNIVGKEIIKKYNLKNVTFYDFGYIIQAAALAHDIGNPPFGHKGEAAICNFYEDFFEEIENSDNTLLKKDLKNLNKDNFTKFDGNAQGFRIINNLAVKNNTNGLNLTYPVLATFCKYPNTKKDNNFIYTKKIGIFSSEEEIFNNIKQTLNLKQDENNFTLRHPLVFLLEAADDICYLISDTCDAFSVNILDFQEVEKLFTEIAFSQEAAKALTPEYIACISENHKESLQAYKKHKKSNNTLKQKLGSRIIESLASEVINICIHIATKTFLLYEQEILQGNLNQDLLSKSTISTYIKKIRDTAKNKIYNASDKTIQEIRGTTAITEVLKEFTSIVKNFYLNKNVVKYALLNKVYLQEKLSNNNSLTDNLQIINDFIVECTDKDIIKIFNTIKGI